ncbi:MAG: GNAT family N-acetyltransferase [Promethearchaeota archaeon]|jgi:GNAT superfamily N-acetyltransferase
MELINNNEKYYEFIRLLRTHPENIHGFLEQVEITVDQQEKYMEKYGNNYFIALENGKPVGWVGDIDNDIRICTHPKHKNKGVGKFMLNALMEIRPKALGKVLLGNESSVNLFRSCGFVEYRKDSKYHYFRRISYNPPKHNPYAIVKMFEEEVAHYTGAPYAVSVDSCTNAIFLSLQYMKYKGTLEKEINIPAKTYLSVPQSIIHAGFEPVFDTTRNKWEGIYQLDPLPIYDAAKRFTSNMYIDGSFMCLSFHIKKHLKIGKGGMILTDDKEAVKWFKTARYEGRSEKLYHEDDIKMLGWNMYMTPQQASHGLSLMQNYPTHVPDFAENGGYRDLTEFTVFKNYKKI